jgi:hypothetical protein
LDGISGKQKYSMRGVHCGEFETIGTGGADSTGGKKIAVETPVLNRFADVFGADLIR